MIAIHRLGDAKRLCAHLLRSRAVYAPQLVDGEARYARIEAAIDLPERALRPLFSPKQAFFAERETLYRFERGRFVTALPEVSAQALFGVAPCDLAAIAYQDRFFAADAHYRRRREATLIVAADCTRACDGGFCHVMQTGPDARPGIADLVLHREDGSWLLVVESEAGAAALHGLDLAGTDADAGEAGAVRARSAARVRAELVDAAPLARGLALARNHAVPDARWDAIGLQCVACTGCTTVCPTCSCFAPRDVPGPDGGGDLHRERVWDSCLLGGFAREASGHHPAPSPGQRVQRFFDHKLAAEYVSPEGISGCVGCGRCDVVCPGSIGMRAVLARVGTP